MDKYELIINDVWGLQFFGCNSLDEVRDRILTTGAQLDDCEVLVVKEYLDVWELMKDKTNV